MIDPGHGGKDPGTIGRHGTTEKDITLKVASQVKDMLGKVPNTRVLMTRERDVFIELEDRAKFANSKGADLFLSIHVNSHPHKGVRGLEIYHFGEAKDQRALEVAARENGTPLNNTGVGWEYLVADLLTSKKIEDPLELAWTAKQAMVTRLNGRYSTIDHGVKTAPFYVLRFTTMPSILAEIAFMSNPAEEEQMRTQAFLTHIAESIVDGVRTYLPIAGTRYGAPSWHSYSLYAFSARQLTGKHLHARGPSDLVRTSATPTFNTNSTQSTFVERHADYGHVRTHIATLSLVKVSYELAFPNAHITLRALATQRQRLEAGVERVRVCAALLCA